jgi:hypothetical protein
MAVVAAFCAGMTVQRRFDMVSPPSRCESCGGVLVGLKLKGDDPWRRP